MLIRREWPHFIAFDALAVDGEDLRDRPLLERKRRLRALMPRPEAQTRLQYHDHIDGRGVALYEAVWGKDLEGIVAKWKAWPVSHRRSDDVLAEGQESRILADRRTARRLRAAAIGVESIAQRASGALPGAAGNAHN